MLFSQKLLSAFIFALTLSLLPPAIFAQEEISATTNAPDYEIAVAGIQLSTQEAIVGEPIRIYAQIQNLGGNDVTGNITFHKNNEDIFPSQVFSARSGGAIEEVWIDWYAEEGVTELWFDINTVNPGDEDPGNNTSGRITIAIITPPPADVNQNPNPGGGETSVGDSYSEGGGNNNGGTNNNNNGNNSSNSNGSNSGNSGDTTPTNGTSGDNGNGSNEDETEENGDNPDNTDPELTPGAVPANSGGGGLNSASVTASVPATPYNTPKEPFFDWKKLKEWFDGLDPMLVAYVISGIVGLFLLILALIFWKRGRSKDDEDMQKFTEKPSDDETYPPVITPKTMKKANTKNGTTKQK